jgi:hypothetical protein
MTVYPIFPGVADAPTTAIDFGFSRAFKAALSTIILLDSSIDDMKDLAILKRSMRKSLYLNYSGSLILVKSDKPGIPIFNQVYVNSDHINQISPKQTFLLPVVHYHKYV